jgi:hypothetical protein
MKKQKNIGIGEQSMNNKQKITEILKAYTKKHNISASSVILEEYAEELIANGVIVPKFNVGDTVWYITGIHRTIVKSAIVEKIIINRNGVSDLYVKNDMGGYFENSVDIFYKTKEEAEEKLKELG